MDPEENLAIAGHDAYGMFELALVQVQQGLKVDDFVCRLISGIIKTEHDDGLISFDHVEPMSGSELKKSSYSTEEGDEPKEENFGPHLVAAVELEKGQESVRHVFVRSLHEEVRYIRSNK